MSSFVHIHVHSHYSILDGMSSISGLVNKAVANNMPAIAITDHGNMFGVKEFINCIKKKNKGLKSDISVLEAKLTQPDISDNERANIQQQIDNLKKKFIKPIIGVEAYVARRGMKTKESPEDRSGYHLVLLAKNKTGYKNLCKLVSASWIDGVYYRPRIDHDLLEQYSEGLIASSACLAGEIHRSIQKDNIAQAEKAVLWYKKVFGDDYYLELQRHKTDKDNADYTVYERQTIQNSILIDIARKTNTKLIASNDVHFVEEEHAEAHERLICLSTGKDLDDPNRMRYTKQEWLKTPEEMYNIFSDIPEAIENTLEIAHKIEEYDIDSPPMMPMFPIPEEFGTEQNYKSIFGEEDLRKEFGEGFDILGGYDKVIRVKLESDYLTKLAYEGARFRYGEELIPEQQERIDYELNVMKRMGYPGYFLIVQDFISTARRMGVWVGPGRGSAAGSVVAYCLKITDIDPLKYDLLFERFLNPDRISMPDIDIDFDDDGRGEVLRWVTEKYGKERVAHIVTYGTMATKSSIKDVARVQRLPLSEAERLTKLIPDKLPEGTDGKAPDITIKNCLKYVPALKDERNSLNPLISNTLKYAEMLEGTVRQTGVHACGVIIGAQDLSEIVPLSTAIDKDTSQEILVTQYEGSVIEEVGLVKMDFLGLKTLSIIKQTIENIKKSKGINLDINTIPIDDKKTYELYSKGLTVGTFQFESVGMQKHLQALQPTQFEDLIAMNALYRPGPMQYIPSFVNRKHGREPIEYPFPIMEKRLKDTYGITVYQEQVMLLSRDLAGFTRGQSDELRKAMGKKLIDKMEALKVKFIDGCINNGYGPQEKIEKIWSDWAEFAKYAFNKSHATCYSWISYQTAYLKAHYTAEYMAALLTLNKDDITEVSKFMDECRRLNIRVLGPDVNESDLKFTVNLEGNIRFGLGGVKNVGGSAVLAIIEERQKNGKFRNFFNFIERVNLNSCNKKNIESLALSGAFDEFKDICREQFFVENTKGELVLDTIMRYGSKYQADASTSQNSLFGEQNSVEIRKPETPFAEEWSTIEKLNKERELIGMYLSAHPLDEFEFELNNICNCTTVELSNLESLTDKTLKIGGMVSVIREGVSKAGKPYMIFTLEDFSGTHEFALFGKMYDEYARLIKKGVYVFITATVQEKKLDNSRPVNESNQLKELRLNVQKIIYLHSLKDEMLHNLTVTFNLSYLEEEFAMEFTDIILNNKGKVNLYVDVYDEFSKSKIKLFSRKNRFELNKDVYHFLKQSQAQSKLEYSVS